MRIRKELPEDIEAIYKLNVAAFESTAEAVLVNKLRETGELTLSLVAVDESEIVGHIAFSSVNIAGSNKPNLCALGLAPMAVLSEYQRKGIGTQLVQDGLRFCAEAGYDVVVVLGHPNFYPRFGFFSAKQFGIKCEYDVSEDVFMVKVLREGILQGVTGVVKYNHFFNDVE